VIYAWAQHVHHARIGIVGLTLQYPLTGSTASNHVQYLGVARPHGGFAPAPTCRQWRTTVNRGRYDFVAVASPTLISVALMPELRWTQTSPNARPIRRQYKGDTEIGVVFRITGPLDPATCPR
jgi:hypothetical protein